MDLQNLMPQQAQPINRLTSGQLPTELAELSEEMLSAIAPTGNASLVSPASADYLQLLNDYGYCELGSLCSYDGDDAE